MSLPAKPNIILIVTDQQRAPRGFPEGWAARNLPWQEHLRVTGITYRRMYINTSPCWPSRATLISGTYPMTHQVIPFGNTLAPELANLSAIMRAAGYDVAYKGKWHLTNEFDRFAAEWAGVLDEANARTAAREDAGMLRAYGFDGWTSPDMGTERVQGPNPGRGDLANLGGGVGGNDERIVSGTGLVGARSVLDFIRERQRAERPYCLIVSLVNPHDVSVYPDCLAQAGYSLDQFSGYEGFSLPRSYGDDLSTKPYAQLNYLRGYEGGPLGEEHALNYLKFYAFLHTLADAQIGRIVDAMTPEQRATTLVMLTSDHGEMGTAHGGLREKMNSFYEETINIPLVISNPVLFPSAAVSEELVSLIDMPTTLGAIAGVDLRELALNHRPQGIDFSHTLWNPSSPTQDAVLFTFYSGYNFDVHPTGLANVILAVITKRWKYAVYFRPDPAIPKFNPDNATGLAKPWRPAVAGDVQYELYDLVADPDELRNLLPVGAAASDDARARQWELHALLTELLERNGSLPGEWAAAGPFD